MSVYTIALFLHVTGAIGYCIGIASWLFTLIGLRRAQRVGQVRTLVQLNELSGPFSGICTLLLFASGLYMALTAWSMQTGWILVALISLVLMVPAVAIIIAPRRGAINRLSQELPEGAPLSEKLAQHTHDRFLATTLQTVAALLLGLIFLMTNKPDVLTSLLVMAIALLLGLASSVLVRRTKQTANQAVPTGQSQGKELAN